MALLPMLAFWLGSLGVLCWSFYYLNNSLASSTKLSILTYTLVGGGIASLWLLAVIRGLTKRIARLRKAALEIGSGNLVGKVPLGRSDELGGVFNAVQIMRNHLFEIVFQINKASVDLSRASTNMLNNTSATAKSAAEQSKASSTIATALEEFHHSFERISCSTKVANQASHYASQVAKTGSETVHSSIKEFSTLAESVESAAAKLRQLEGLSQNVDHIVSTIRAIADQTNLLALNAAIEAARVGEQGRGFAVVADEVRSLAERTATATIEITSTVQQIQSHTQEAVIQMHSSLDRVQEVGDGVGKAEAAGDSVASIEIEAEKVVTAIKDIELILSQQTEAIRAVAQNINGIASLAANNSAQANESLDACQDVEATTKLLQQLSQEFKVFRS